MADPITGKIIGGIAERKAAKKAGKAQQKGFNRGLEELRGSTQEAIQPLQPFLKGGLDAFNRLSEFEDPSRLAGMTGPYGKIGLDSLQSLGGYQTTGLQGMEEQAAMLGLRGADAERRSLDSLERSPYLAELMSQGEEAILQHGSATGGLRGGRTQDALMRYRPEVFRGLYDQRLDRLGGVSALGAQTGIQRAQIGTDAGQALLDNAIQVRLARAQGGLQAASGISGIHEQAGVNIANLRTGKGAAKGQNIIARNRPLANVGNDAMEMASLGLKAFGAMGGAG